MSTGQSRTISTCSQRDPSHTGSHHPTHAVRRKGTRLSATYSPFAADAIHDLQLLERFAAGIAREGNNLTGIIGGALEVALGRHPDDEWLLRAQQGVERERALLRELTRLGRPSTGEVRPEYARCDLAAVTRTAMIESRRHLLPGVEQTFHTGLSHAAVLGDPQDLGDLVMLLLQHARAAVEARTGGACEGCRVEVRLLATAVPAPGYVLEVADNGDGIPEALLPRIFEPFFETAGSRLGLGIGLASAVAVTRDHGGTIEVESAVGRGTTFRVWLPEARAS